MTVFLVYSGFYSGDRSLVGVAESQKVAEELILEDKSLYGKLGFDLPSYEVTELKVQR